MKRKRRDKPPVDREVIRLIVALCVAFEDNLERCRRLSEQRRAGVLTAELRGEALDGARRIAYVSRVLFEATMHLGFMDSTPEEFLPVGLFGALARLAYTLTALAEEDSESETLLSPAELNGLSAQYEIVDWVEHCRSRNPDLRSEDQ
jgi:hypothetical protein